MKDRIAYAFGAEFVEVRVNKWTHKIPVDEARTLMVRSAPSRVSNHEAPETQQ
jgi:hypothetical protein